MSAIGPPIEALVRRLSETPGEFLAEPRILNAGDVVVAAVVCDVLSDLGYELASEEIDEFLHRSPSERNWMRLVLIAAWLAHDSWFRQSDGHGERVIRWLQGRLRRLAKLVDAEQFVLDPDRREELARGLLAELGLVPDGETEQQAADRLTTVDSLERARVLAETRAKRERAEKLRKEMDEKRAREAAARYTRE